MWVRPVLVAWAASSLQMGGGAEVGRVGMLLATTAVDVNIVSFSSVTLGDSGYLIIQMCWGLPVSRLLSPCLPLFWVIYLSTSHPCIHCTQGAPRKGHSSIFHATSTDPSTHLTFPALGLRPWWSWVGASWLLPGDLVIVLSPVSA